MGATSGAAGGLLAAEVCAPLLLLCWLCCWPQDTSSDNSSDGKHPQRPALTNAHESGSRRRYSDMFTRRIGSSAMSLHLPSTSGYKKPLSAHRSHEEIVRRKSNHDSSDPETRYHSAPSVIDEVIHRRDWERSTKDLYIPLKPDIEVKSNSSDSPEVTAPHAEAESSSIEDIKNEAATNKACKKHHTNIKSSRGRKEKESTDIKDADATETEPSNFYIGENDDEEPLSKNKGDRTEDVHTKSIYKAKDAKQSFNESIRNKERPRHTLGPVDEHRPSLGFCLDDVIEQLDSLDRSGAEHHTIESRLSLSNRVVYPPPSVEPVGYEGGVCYLGEDTVSTLRAPRGRGTAAGGAGGVGALRARHASDGDILAPPHRPESGAFSESDLDFELEDSDERPPSYEELHQYATPEHKETAI